MILWNLFLTSICITFLPLLTANTSMPVSDTLQFSRTFMENTSTINTIIGSISCIIWGTLYDAIESKPLLLFSVVLV